MAGSGEIKDEKVMLVESITCVVLCTSEESGDRIKASEAENET